ncbi:MAG: DEAD/DEAH box helicase [Chloroflexi bacterium]|nr:DEAD/DEAH box helicase [Chloroflexota bacterium]
MPTSHFHPLVREWFERRFGEPTPAQAEGWPAIASGRHTLIAAPTGSGKTLAAFLTSLDMLVRQALEPSAEDPSQPQGLPDSIQIVYVSPLKALANDIKRNLLDPLAEITALAEERGTPLPEIRVAVRTGDTSAKERALHAKRPPHVLITTPESLFILLTSERGRHALASVHTLILDELHAVVPNKRGSHLALSVERLCRLADGPVTRIGLSATQKPIETVARFLTGTSDPHPNPLPAQGEGEEASAPPTGERTEVRGRSPAAMVDTGGSYPDCAIVDTGHKRDMDLAVVLPDGFELGPIATHEQWAQILDQITELVNEHRTTLVFVNTRRLAERVAHLLSERIGEENVAAHHGSLSMEVRFDAEQRLKAGAVKVCVATASLELGIDVGVVDLVCLIGSPRSIGVALQRIGRSGHWLGGTPKGRLFPLTRDELVETAALLRAIGAGALDALAVPPWPLDVLAQQIVAVCVTEEWAEDDLFAFVRTAYPYRELPRERFDDVVRMLAEGVANRWGRGSAYLHRDGVHHTLKARRGARLAAITSGGTIPDTADYLVIAEPDGTVVGAVNEDFAIESMAGDIFLLGNTPWKIRRIESGTVRVEEAHGQSPTIPFWTGEAPGRTRELSAEVSALRQGVDERLARPEEAVAWVMEGGASREAAEQIVAYIAEGKRVLGLVPTAERLIAERFFDEAGGMQLVIHSPLGSRINRAWGLALRKRFCVGFNYELQASATDEGINIALGPQHSFPVADVFGYVKSPTARDVLLQAVLQAPVFGTRWRWTVSRSLTLLRRSGGKRVPTPIQRMRADDLLAAVFPAAAACQDNMAPGEPIELPDHPLVFETVRDCLTEALDVEGFTALLGRIERHEIEVYGKDTLQPSVFSHQILNAMPYAFLDDAPLEERRARAVALRRALPENAQDLGSLDPDAIAQEQENAWPPVRDVDETHDALLSLGVLCEADIAEHAGDPAQWRMWLDDLAADGRVQTLEAGGRTFWLATERAEGVRAAYAGSQEAIVELVRGRVESTGPFTVAELALRLALDVEPVRQAAAQLEAEGVVLRGAFRPGAAGDEFCDRRILARIHRSTIGRLRRAVEPVPAASLLRFLLEWQHATPGSRLSGDAGLVEVVEQLQGFEAAAAAWEGAVLTNRLTDFHPSTLDALCFGGELAWGRLARRSGDAPSVGLSRNGPVSIALREDLPWLLDPPSEDAEALTGPAAEVLDYLSAHGASFAPDIVAGTRQLPSQVEEALWVLVAAGRVTADGFSALRGLVSGLTKKVRRSSRFASRTRGTTGRAGSRWSLLRAAEPDPADDLVEARAAQLLRRYGVVTRELLTREPMAPPWWKLVRAYRRAEARGEVRGGRFVAGFVGEQFALPEAVDALRAVHRRERTGEVVRLSACDPLNLVGILTPGPRIPAVVGNEVLYRDGVPIEPPAEAVASA